MSLLGYTITDYLDLPLRHPAVPPVLLYLQALLRSRRVVLDHAIGAASAGSRLFVELLAKSVDEEGILLFRNGAIIAGEGLGCGVLDAEASRYLN
jgi:hypothetical protein